jgi:hypothetical protein
MVVTQQQTPELPELVDAADEGDRPSITEVNGTVARLSMAYSPGQSERFAFGVPLLQRLPSFLYMGFAVAIATIVLTAYNSPSSSSLFIYVVEGDRGRMISSMQFMFFIVCTALFAVVRGALRGVIVTGSGIETRTLVGPMPRVRKWAWSQIDRLIVDDEDVMLELWNGTYERLPKVREGKALADLLERIAAARGRPVTRLDPKTKNRL